MHIFIIFNVGVKAGLDKWLYYFILFIPCKDGPGMKTPNKTTLPWKIPQEKDKKSALYILLHYTLHCTIYRMRIHNTNTVSTVKYVLQQVYGSLLVFLFCHLSVVG